ALACLHRRRARHQCLCATRLHAPESGSRRRDRSRKRRPARPGTPAPARGRRRHAAGEHALARGKILSAYLDGFEPVEPMLRARDAGLMAEVETAMARLRADIGSRAPVAEVQARVDEVAAMNNGTGPGLTVVQYAGGGGALGR